MSHILCVSLCYIRLVLIYFIVLFLEDLYSVNLNILIEYSAMFFFRYYFVASTTYSFYATHSSRHIVLT